VLEWEPQTQLDEGLAKTIEYFDSLLGNRDFSPSTAAELR